MNRIILTLIFTIISINIYSQLAVLDTIEMKKGVYKTLEEFQNNTPSIPMDFILKEKNIGYGGLTGGSIKRYRPDIKRKEFNELINTWGLCDSQKFYICVTDEGGYTWFYPLKSIHSEPYFQMIPYNFYPDRPRTMIFVLLNLDNGQKTELNSSKMKKLLKENDPLLFSQFKAESDKAEKVYDYYLKYKSRNP